MNAMINPVADILALAGTGLLVAAFLRIRRLSRELSNSAAAFRWRLLDGYIAFFILGYIAYAAVFWNHREHLHDLIIAVILFFGAVFVWVVSSLALQTVQDMRRVALLEQQSITDALTGLYNRRYLDGRISAEFASARRYGHPLSVMMLDIDHFKQLNDTYGHQGGDLALQFVGRLILDGIREPDIAARYGGEEFIIIATNTRLPSAGELAERLRRRIEMHELKLARAGEDRQTLHLTVSVGVAELTPDVASCEQLVEQADQAMYQAKQAGRNRTVTYHPSLS